MRRFVITVACAAMLVFGASSAAVAAEPDTYGPSDPGQTPTLAGSLVVPVCSSNVPWITYNVVLNDPDGVSTTHAARLVLSNGSQTVTYALGELVDNKLSGRLLWPGASIGSDGNGNGWPGWTFSNGVWSETSGNFAWTRGNITAMLEVNPSITLPLHYPDSTAACMTAPGLDAEHVETTTHGNVGSAVAGVAAATDPALATTGGDSAAVVPLLWTAGALVAGGGALLLVRRARRSRG